MQNEITATKDTSLTQAQFFNRVYTWMASGVALTGVVAYLIHNSQLLHKLLYQPSVVIPLFILQLIMVITITYSAAAKKLGTTLTTSIFLLYAIISGVTLSGILEFYTKQSIYQAFGITAATFTACSIYGFVTKKDLTTLGSLCLMAVWGLILALLVSMFLANTWLDIVINVVGILAFVGLTAYDTQKLQEYSDDPDMAPLGSLILYLDFINLFIYILRLSSGNGSKD